MRRGRALRSPRRAVCRCAPMSKRIRGTRGGAVKKNRKINNYIKRGGKEKRDAFVYVYGTYLRVRDLRRVHEGTVDRIELEEIRVLLRAALVGRLLRSGDGQQFPRVAPFRVQGRPQIAAYRNRRHVVERS